MIVVTYPQHGTVAFKFTGTEICNIKGSSEYTAYFQDVIWFLGDSTFNYQVHAFVALLLQSNNSLHGFMSLFVSLFLVDTRSNDHRCALETIKPKKFRPK